MTMSANARDYLADDLGLESEDHPDYEEWFEGLVGYLGQLSPDDELCVRLADCLQPFLDDDQRLDGTLYPNGSGFHFMETESPGGDFRRYLDGLVTCLERDYQRWLIHVSRAGGRAEWRTETGPPEI